MKTNTKNKKKKLSLSSRLLNATPTFLPGVVAGAIVGIVVVIAQATMTGASALNISSTRDCSSNAVLTCGALSTAEVQKKYSQQGVSQIYNYYGISAADIDALGRKAVAGAVYKDGTVKVGNKTVATKAVSAGRENISGSTRASNGGVTFYNSPASTSFRQNSIPAYVVLENDVFKYAILAPCGNPVRAVPIPKPTPPPPAPNPTPTPTPTPPTPAPTPPSSSRGNRRNPPPSYRIA